jgi:hypothetical protein
MATRKTGIWDYLTVRGCLEIGRRIALDEELCSSEKIFGLGSVDTLKLRA